MYSYICSTSKLHDGDACQGAVLTCDSFFRLMWWDGERSGFGNVTDSWGDCGSSGEKSRGEDAGEGRGDGSGLLPMSS